MQRIHYITCAVALAAAAGGRGSCRAAPARPGAKVQTGSFMKAQAPSLSVFLARVKTDPVLQKRYGRHLSIDWRAVPDYLAHRLRPDSVKRPAFFTIYNVAGDGTIYPTKQRLAAGTRIYRVGDSEIFFTAKGDPGRPFFVPVIERVQVVPPRPAPPPQPAAPPREETVIVHVPSE